MICPHPGGGSPFPPPRFLPKPSKHRNFPGPGLLPYSPYGSSGYHIPSCMCQSGAPLDLWSPFPQGKEKL